MLSDYSGHLFVIIIRVHRRSLYVCIDYGYRLQIFRLYIVSIYSAYILYIIYLYSLHIVSTSSSSSSTAGVLDGDIILATTSPGSSAPSGRMPLAAAPTPSSLTHIGSAAKSNASNS